MAIVDGKAVRDLARAVRLRDLKAAGAALDRLGKSMPEAAQGRALAEKPKDPPLPPLEVDALKLIAAEALVSFKAKPPEGEWGEIVFAQAKSIAA